MSMVAPKTVIFRPFVWYLTLVLSGGMVAIGVLFVVWVPFRMTTIFQPARAITGGPSRTINAWTTHSLGVPFHSLDIWGAAFFVAGCSLPFIFTPRHWVLGWFGSLLAVFVGLFFTVSLFESVDSAGPTHPIVEAPHPGLFSAVLMIVFTLVVAGIVVAAFLEHRGGAFHVRKR